MILIHKLLQFENTNLFLNYLNFDYNGTYITDQYLDENGKFDVIPVEYYGETYLKSLELLYNFLCSVDPVPRFNISSIVLIYVVEPKKLKAGSTNM